MNSLKHKIKFQKKKKVFGVGLESGEREKNNDKCGNKEFRIGVRKKQKKMGGIWP